MSDNLLLAFILTGIAGVATGIGSCIAFFFNHSNRKFLSLSLGFSGGVMLYISFVELFAGAKSFLSERSGTAGALSAIGAFFGGIALSLLIDRLIPESRNPHEVRKVEEMSHPDYKKRAFRSGILFALAIAIHNFPEGMAVFMSGMISGKTGIPVRNDSPKSPVTALPIQVKYCSTRGLSSPSFFSHMARSSGVCSMPRMPDTTSPGISCMTIKIAMLIPSRIGIRPSSRRII